MALALEAPVAPALLRLLPHDRFSFLGAMCRLENILLKKPILLSLPVLPTLSTEPRFMCLG